jgi:hypothetical protein
MRLLENSGRTANALTMHPVPMRDPRKKAKYTCSAERWRKRGHDLHSALMVFSSPCTHQD